MPGKLQNILSLVLGNQNILGITWPGENVQGWNFWKAPKSIEFSFWKQIFWILFRTQQVYKVGIEG